MVVEEGLAEGIVFRVLTPKLAVGVWALVTAWYFLAQAPFLLYLLQGPHGSCSSRLQPASIDGGQCEVQEQQADLAGFPVCELSPGMLRSQNAEVDEGTAHGDVKVEREEFALHKTESMSGKTSEKQETFVKFPRLPLSSILQAWEGGIRCIRALPLPPGIRLRSLLKV